MSAKGLAELRGLQFDFNDDALFTDFLNKIINALKIVSAQKCEHSFDHSRPASDVHKAMVTIKKENPVALDCIKIRCQRRILFGPPAMIGHHDGITGAEIAEMSVEGFADYMEKLESRRYKGWAS